MELVVSYDINTEYPEGCRRLARVAALCERYGVRVQYSVFECRLSAADREALVGALLELIHPQEDSILVYQLDRPFDKARLELGRPRRGVGGPIIIRPRTLGDP